MLLVQWEREACQQGEKQGREAGQHRQHAGTQVAGGDGHTEQFWATASHRALLPSQPRCPGVSYL